MKKNNVVVAILFVGFVIAPGLLAIRKRGKFKKKVQKRVLRPQKSQTPVVTPLRFAHSGDILSEQELNKKLENGEFGTNHSEKSFFDKKNVIDELTHKEIELLRAQGAFDVVPQKDEYKSSQTRDLIDFQNEIKPNQNQPRDLIDFQSNDIPQNFAPESPRLSNPKRSVHEELPNAYKRAKKDTQEKEKKSNNQVFANRKHPVIDFTRPAGLKNLGASCYFNSVVQCLAVSEVFSVPRLHNTDHSLRAKMVRLFNNLKDHNGYQIKPQAQYKAAIDKFFNGRTEQQCAAEFSQLLIQELADDKFKGQSEIESIFSPCGHRGIKQEEFTSIQLPFVNLGQKFAIPLVWSLEDLFKNDEKIADHRCGGYCQSVGAIKKEKITQAPEILVLSLKRFDNEGKKVCAPVSFPVEGLNIKDYMKFAVNDELYDLFGVVMHSGTAKGGHYTNFVKDPHNKWFFCNDSKIESNQKGTLHKVAETGLYGDFTPYVLMYKKR